MLEDAFDEEVKTFYQSADLTPVFDFEVDLFGSHRKFRDRKYDIYRRENAHYYGKKTEIPTSLAFLSLTMDLK